MSSNVRSKKLKAVLNIIMIGLGIAFLVLLFVFKGSMNTLVSNKVREQAGPDLQKSTEAYVDSAFNYQQNGEGFQLTFLEFGAIGCSACKRMEKVMEEVKTSYPGKVKVYFINVLLPSSQNLMKYYGVVAIPTQVLLNGAGQEEFRHTGYFSFAELEKEFQKLNP